MGIYFLIAAMLGGWVFALILANERKGLVRHMEREMAKKLRETQVGD